MSKPPRQMHINLFFHSHHEAAWRLPASRPRHLVDFEHFRHAAAVAEQGRLDSVFFGDMLAFSEENRRNYMFPLEPLGILSALSGVTSRIGLIATASTTFQDPYNLARRYATLDHLSGGRAGWNIVTSWTDDQARNFGLQRIPEHAKRYLRASEFVEVTHKLWDSWEDGALVGDKASGVYVDTDRVHAIDHEGEHYRIAGPLGVPRSPQGYPIRVVAGSSEEGMDLAARFADAVFTAQRTIPEGKAFYADQKRRVAAVGRDPDQVVILPGVSFYIGSTEQEARRVESDLLDLTHVEFGLTQLGRFTGHEITLDQLDEKFPELPPEEGVDRSRSRVAIIQEMARSEDLTVRQVLGRMAGGRGHRTFVGTPEQVADDLEAWFVAGAADGFNYMPPAIPSQLEVFVDHVIPILQERGLFRREYEGSTLREHYGLRRPRNRLVEPEPTAT